MIATAAIRRPYVIRRIDRLDSTIVLVVDCRDFDAYCALPQALEYRGAIFGLSGWNSDYALAYFRNDVPVAFEALRQPA